MTRNYFSHDSVARNDPKIIALIDQFGLEGYARFFIMCEIFREQTNYRLAKDLCYLPTLTRELYATREEATEFIAYCVHIGLLVEDDSHLWSESFLRRMEMKDGVAKKRAEAAKARWDRTASDSGVGLMQMQCKPDANAMQMHCTSDANAMQERKEEKEKKEKKEKKDNSLIVDFSEEPEIRESETENGDEKIAFSGRDSTPYKEIGEAFNTICSRLKPIKGITDKRKTHIRARMKLLPTIEDWRRLFTLTANSDFLNGDNDRGWCADFDWIVSRENNALKILEGRYANKSKNNGSGAGSGVEARFQGLDQFRFADEAG